MHSPTPSPRPDVLLDETLSDIDVQVDELKEILPKLDGRYVVSGISTKDIQQNLESAINADSVAIFAISNSDRFLHFFHQAIIEVRELINNRESLTSLVITESILRTDFDVRICSSRVIAREGIYPALNLNTSSSCLSSQGHLSKTQRQIATAARNAVMDVEANLYSGALADPDWEFNRVDSKQPAVQAFRFMSQPYFVAEPYTGRKAAFVSNRETIDSLRAILAGEFRNADPMSLQYVNRLTTSK